MAESLRTRLFPFFRRESTIPVTEKTHIYVTDNKPKVDVKSLNVEEQFKSQVEAGNKALKNFFNSDKQLVDHPFDFNQLLELQKSFGPIHGVVSKYKDFILGPGFHVISKDQKIADVLNEWNDTVQFKSVLDSIVTTALVTGTVGVELGTTTTGAITEIKLIEPKTFFIKQDTSGTVTGACQILTSQKVPIDFKSEEVAIFTINKVGTSPYGLGIVHSTLPIIDNILQVQKDVHKLIKRKANSPLWAKMGGQFGTEIVEPKEADIQTMSSQLEYMNNKTEFATGPYVDFKVLDFGRIGEKFEVVMQDDWKLFFTTVQVPQVLLGDGNVAEGLATVQMDAFERRVQSLQDEIEKVIETQVYSRVLKAAGLEGRAKATFVWGLPSNTEKNQRLDRVTTILQNPLLNTDLRVELEMEIAKLLELKYSQSPAVEKKKELQVPQPQLPIAPALKQQSADAKNIIEQITFKKHIHEFDFSTDELKKDYSLNEYVGFNVHDYIGAIVKHIAEDGFTLLAAKNAVDKAAGYLSSNQITALRDVLSEGITNGWSMQKIAKEIEVGVKPGDLYRTNDDGSLMLDANGDKVLKLSKEYRPSIIARTEVVRASNNGAIDEYKQDNVQKTKWVAALSERTCEICSNGDGTVYDINDSVDVLPIHANCRCRMIAVVEGLS